MAVGYHIRCDRRRCGGSYYSRYHADKQMVSECTYPVYLRVSSS